jgi:hypothetical protein
MAIIQPGSLIADIRGKCGDNVYSRNHAGAIVRSVGTWEQPEAGPLVDCQAALELVSKAWSSDLSQARRDAWTMYGQLYPGCNRWGESRPRGGLQCFVRANFIRARLDLAVAFLDAPPSPPLHRPTIGLQAEAHGGLGFTGACTPDVTGSYALAGIYGTRPYWRRTDGAYFVWWLPEYTEWELGPTLGTYATAVFYRVNHLLGTYYPQHGSTGYPPAAKDDESSALQITPPVSGDPLNINGMRLYVYVGDSSSPGRSYYAGPWHYLASAAYTTLWTPAWARWATPALLAHGAHLWTRTIAQHISTGEISSPSISRCTEAPFVET